MTNRRRAEREFFVGRKGGSVFVGPLMSFALPSRGEVVRVCALFTLPGMIDDLHQFADGLGLRRAWFQYHHTLPHYDLAENVRVRALGRGAHDGKLADLCDAVRAWRETAAGCRAQALEEQLGEPAERVNKDPFLRPEERPASEEEAEEFYNAVAEVRASLGAKK